MNLQLSHSSILVISHDLWKSSRLVSLPRTGFLGSLAGWQWVGLIIDLRCGPGVSGAHVNQLWGGRELLSRTDKPDE